VHSCAQRSPSAQPPHMTDALKLAADAGDLKEVRRLVDEEKTSVTQADAWGDTALHAAVAKGRIGITTIIFGVRLQC
jgi:hypothetical protein